MANNMVNDFAHKYENFAQKKIPIDYLINPGDPIPDHYWSWVPAC